MQMTVSALLYIFIFCVTVEMESWYQTTEKVFRKSVYPLCNEA